MMAVDYFLMIILKVLYLNSAVVFMIVLAFQAINNGEWVKLNNVVNGICINAARF
jgi:hypothetical protein